MEPFTETPVCVKCWNSEVDLRHRPTTIYRGKELRECLIVICKCGYRWTMETADSTRLD